MLVPVRHAARERPEPSRADGESHLADRLLAIGRDAAARLDASGAELDGNARLYGDDGLPR